MKSRTHQQRSYKLLPATLEDVPWLNDLRREAYRELFNLTWGAWDEQRHRRHFAESISQGGIEIITVDGRGVGMLQLVVGADAIEVAEIQILPVEQSLGVGSAVLHDVIRAARRCRVPVRLSTGRKNERARSLYERLGFRVTATTDTHFHLEID